MILAIGEILFDIFPTYKRLGGAPFNFAAHLRALEIPVIFVSRIGNDENGETISQELRRKRFDLKYIQQDDHNPTGHVRVTLDAEGSPEFDIVRNVAYDELEYTDGLASALTIPPRLIYYGTLIQRTERGADTVMKILENRPPGTKCLCDINLRPNCYTPNVITKSLVHSDILKINNDELKTLRSLLGAAPIDDKSFVDDLMHTFAIEWVCLTSGKDGSTLFTRNGIYTAPADTPPKVRDTVGAGDAYAAILAAGYLGRWPPDLILKRATRFAGAICEIKGAVPEDDLFYQKFSGWITEETSDEG